MQEAPTQEDKECHNPYFNRWFSAIDFNASDNSFTHESQSLF